MGPETGYYMMGGGVMWFFPLIFIGLFIVFVMFLFKQNGNKTDTSNSQESALDILKKRYASGEINKEEFDRLKKDLV